ncbi:hypothetical protein LSH36_61g06028 [Paralvinella palmiformis]|uniref:RRM domain-containing protein n=1 Tax=Paralvinella palmiformis TaxID=53620 RepID=A0AAD9K4C2_9ANNE|nr:hypothetical protein LSH36_61g06028 [Paralvinella palmiformis]
MTVIIRLQNLPWAANALDIRQFFQGLSIPDGGVHIVGGEKGDAFIAFSTDDDARQAMYMDGQRIRDIPVKLLLSSKTEMQNVIAVARGMAQGGSNPNPIAGPGGPQMGVQGGMAPGMRPGMVGGPGIGSSQPTHGGFGTDMRDGRAGDLNEYNNNQGQFDSHAGPSRLGGFGGDRMGGPDHMGGIEGGSDRKVGGPDRLGSCTDRLISPDCMSGPDRLMGGPDHMGSFDRMGGNLDRIGGTDIGGRMPAASLLGSDHMGGSSDRVGGGRLGGGSNFMGGADFSRLDNPEPIVGNVRRLGGLDRIGGGFDRFSNTDSLGGSRMGDLDRVDSFRGPDRLAISGKGDFMGSGNQFPERGGIDRFREADYDMGRGNFGMERREIEDRPVGGGFGQDLFGQRQQRFEDNWDKRHSDGVYGGNNLMTADTDRREGRGRGFADNFSGPLGMDLDSRSGFGRNMPLRDTFERNGFGRNSTHDGNNRDVGFGERLDPGYLGEYGGTRMDLNSSASGVSADFSGNRRMGDTGFEHGHYSRSPVRDSLSRFSPDRNFHGGRGGFVPRGGFHGHEVRKHTRDHDAYVIISNMPTTVNYKDVRRFFHGLEIPREGLKLINDKHGERIGEAFVMFAKDIDSTEALKRSGHMMGHKKVQIRKCSVLDFDNAVDSFVPGHGRPPPPGVTPPAKRNRSRSPLTKLYPESCCIILKNLPFKCHKDDIRKFLGHLKLKHGGPFIDIGLDGRPSGNAYVELETKKDQEEAMALHRKVLFGRSVEIYMISKNEYDSKIKRDDVKDGGDKRMVEIRSDKDEKDGKEKEKELKESSSKDEDSRKYYCIRMRGLPFSTTPQMIRDFFGGLEIGNRGIHIVYTRQGQAAGMAYVEFVTSVDCKKAVEKDKQYIGKRYIEISPMAKKDMLEELETEQQRQNGTVPSSGPPGAARASTSTLTMSNLPFKVQLEDIMEFFRGFRAIQDSVRLRYSKEGKPMGDAMVKFTNQHEAQRAQRELNRKMLLGRPIFLAPAK